MRQDQIRRARANRGFTLIEIMAVVLIIGLLSGIVGFAVFQQVDKGRAVTAKAQIANLEGVLELYRMDNGFFPTSDQGLDALVQPPASAPEPRNYPPGGYLKGGRVPVDPWGEPYQYEAPGSHNAHGYDLWSLGADGSPGGEGVDADISNWSGEEFGGSSLAARLPRRGGYTLLEILAVIAIFALLMSFALPNLDAFRARSLRQQAERLSAHLELARQRAVVTGIPHRLWIDLDEAAYRVEWLRSDDELEGREDAEPERLDLRRDVALPLSAPRAAERSFRPVVGRFGRETFLQNELDFAGVETSEGFVQRGEAYVEFERDGTTLYTTILIDEQGGQRIALEVLPLAENVRIYDETI